MTDRIVKFLAWFSLAAIVFVTVSPIGLRPTDMGPVDFDRALAFAALSGLFVLSYPRHWPWVAAALLLGAFAIELLQELSPSRHARLSDALVKATGVMIGVMAGWAIAWLRSRFSQQTYR